MLMLQLLKDGVVEEKTIERTNHNLFLNAAFIEQGHLLEQNCHLLKQHCHTYKKKLLRMLPFGANKKLSRKENVGFVNVVSFLEGTIGVVLNRISFYVKARGQIFNMGVLRCCAVVIFVGNVQINNGIV